MAGHIRTHYTEAGSNGPTVVLCHGGGPGSSGEAGFGRILPLLADRFQIFAPDGVGGYGETDPYWPANEGAQSRVDQLEAFIDALCLDNICLAGNSQGAWVAAKYALTHPDRVSKLFLIASLTISGAMGLKTPETEGLRALRSYDGTKESMRRVMEALVYDKSVITDELIEIRNAAANRPGAANAREVFEEGQARLTRDLNLRLKFEMSHTLPRLTIPTVFAWGEDDTFAPAATGRELEQMLPNIPFHFIPKGGHQVQTDQPQALAKLMIEHFG
ncbi:MAG TPA: alpha/beta hydrolase [Chloroflexota bacterium]|nr:alpha/beta hydrolase [Chloroflexota bacterium]